MEAGIGEFEDIGLVGLRVEGREAEEEEETYGEEEDVEASGCLGWKGLWRWTGFDGGLEGAVVG